MISTLAVRIPTPQRSQFLFFASPLSTTTTSSASSSCFAMQRSVRIAVVGDVHDEWDLEEDSEALNFLQPDLVLFTGDFGNENVELVRSISNLKMPKAAILGNHDCWRTHQFSQKKADRVQLQLECLGEQHVGYHRLDYPTLNLSVVGGRPFSCGGDRLFRPRLIFERYGVNDMEGSAKKICEAASGTPDGHSMILLAHNGPTGLGSEMNDICGRDWVFGGGDHGDSDLAQAIADLKISTASPIPLVVFGHMHSRLQYGSALRKMITVDADNTIYLNGAIVPRVRRDCRDGSSSGDRNELQIPGSKVGTFRAFTLVEILDGRVARVSETWVSVGGGKTAVEEEKILFESP